jgi:hypothetical protein
MSWITNREYLAAVVEWYGWQAESFNERLKNPIDALQLFDYAQCHPELPEMAEDWEAKDLTKALGYNPWGLPAHEVSNRKG